MDTTDRPPPSDGATPPEEGIPTAQKATDAATPEDTAPESTPAEPEQTATPTEESSHAAVTTASSPEPGEPGDTPTGHGALTNPPGLGNPPEFAIPNEPYGQPTLDAPAAQYGQPTVDALTGQPTFAPGVQYSQPGAAYYGQPPALPTPTGPPKSVTAAVLLNLTGLGIGYGYLRRFGWLAVALAITLGLVVVAFVVDAAGNPWLWRGIAAGWLAVIALHTTLVARRQRATAPQRGPAIAGVVAVAVLVGGYVGYGVIGGSVYDDGLAAQAAGDCATAVNDFDTVTGPFELTLSSDVTAAADRRTECETYTHATDAQQRGDHDTAIGRYLAFTRAYPNSVLAPFVHTTLADAHLASATDWQEPLTAEQARASVDTLLMVSREFSDTPAAKKVPEAITDAFAAANKPYEAGKFCDALPALTYFAALAADSAGEIVATANTNRARALLECGLSQVRAGDTEATTTLDTFVTAYPQHPGVPQGTSALITAKVALAANVTLPVPPPLGGNDPGTIPVTFYNDSNEPLLILVAGPTAHEISLGPCAVCPADYPSVEAACPTYDGRPSVTLHLTAAQYYLTTERQSAVASFTDSITPQPGYEHFQCLFVQRQG
jgi:TolA-binding protein